jgi:hypothetical protein
MISSKSATVRNEHAFRDAMSSGSRSRLFTEAILSHSLLLNI